MGRQDLYRAAQERRQVERRQAFTRAAIHHAREIERRQVERRANDNAQVNAWESKFHAARLAAQIGVE